MAIGRKVSKQQMVLPKNSIWVIGIILAFFAFSQGEVFSGAITGAETIALTVPSTMNPGETFDIELLAEGVSGLWGASIIMDISGGCSIDGDTHLEFVMLSDSPNPVVYEVTAPSTGKCTFSGNYKFGEMGIIYLTTTEVSVGQVCAAVCLRPIDKCIKAEDTSNGCDGFCGGEWNVVKRTSIDADCNDIINRGELGQGIIQWIDNSFSRDDLGIGIQSWVSNQ